jgi:hypothetical protein
MRKSQGRMADVKISDGSCSRSRRVFAWAAKCYGERAQRPIMHNMLKVRNTHSSQWYQRFPAFSGLSRMIIEQLFRASARPVNLDAARPQRRLT